MACPALSGAQRCAALACRAVQQRKQRVIDEHLQLALREGEPRLVADNGAVTATGLLTHARRKRDRGKCAGPAGKAFRDGGAGQPTTAGSPHGGRTTLR